MNANAASAGRVGEQRKQEAGTSMGTRTKISRIQTKNFLYELYEDQVRWWRGALLFGGGFSQPENIVAILCHVEKRGLAIDVGSHMGMNSMAYSRIFDRVVAFEPQVRLYRQALRHFRLNEIDTIEAHNCALGDRAKVMSLTCEPFQDPDLGNDGMFRLTRPKASLPKVNVRTLDSFGLSPDFIKIDVEGFEKLVLQGAKETIARSRPALLIETTWFQNFQEEHKALNAVESYREEDYEIVRYLKTFGYEPFFPTAKLTPIRTKKQFEEERHMDTLFLPTRRSKR